MDICSGVQGWDKCLTVEEYPLGASGLHLPLGLQAELFGGDMLQKIEAKEENLKE